MTVSRQSILRPPSLTDQLAARLSLTPAGTERLESLRRNCIAPQYAHLAEKIQAEVGGHYVLMPSIEEDYEALLARGRSWPVKPRPTLMKGERSQCHRNSANLYEQNPGRVSIVTGYGLSLDGDGLQLWRQHTWLWDRQRRRVVETTVVREAYWGVELTDSEADVFCAENW